MRSPASWIERHAAFAPDKTALRDGQQNLSYAKFAARIACASRWLEQEWGLSAGDRLAWLGPNSSDFLALFFACMDCGITFVPLNWRLSAAELAAIARDGRITLAVVDASCARLMLCDDDWGIVPAEELGAVLDSYGAHKIIPAAIGKQIDPETPALLVYTSGTTGRPKGAVLSQRAILFNALNAVHMHDMKAADRILTVLPMFHVGGLNIQTLPALYCGAEIILHPRFEPATTLETITAERPTLTTLVPAMINALMTHPAWLATSLSSLRSITTGSTDVPRAMIEAIHERAVPVIQIYGSTETGPVAIYQRADEAMATVGAIGRAGLHTEVRLVDAQGAEVADGSDGEILVRGPHIANGYWDATSGQAVAFADGWFASGDVATRDSDGLYWFRDRIKHLIISGGENIYPAELERILNASSHLQEAAVVGRPDARWGEVPVVVAVPSSAVVTEHDILQCFADRIARYKHPHAVVFVDALPRTALGKVDLGRLRDLL